MSINPGPPFICRANTTGSVIPLLNSLATSEFFFVDLQHYILLTIHKIVFNTLLIKNKLTYNTLTTLNYLQYITCSKLLTILTNSEMLLSWLQRS